MAAPIDVGDFVECIGDVSRSAHVTPVRTGGIYCVEAIVPAIGDCPACGEWDDTGLIFSGHPKQRAFLSEDEADDLLLSWCPCRFRPIYRPRADLIESLKAPPERVREPA